MPLPTLGFDPTEAAVPWFEFAEEKDFEVIFSTKSGF